MGVSDTRVGVPAGPGLGSGTGRPVSRDRPRSPVQDHRVVGSVRRSPRLMLETIRPNETGCLELDQPLVLNRGSDTADRREPPVVAESDDDET